MHPEGSTGTWRDLPGLLAASVRLVWGAGRREFLITSALQLLTAAGVTVQLFAAKAVLTSVLDTRGSGAFTDVLPALGALVGITVALEFAQAVENEQSRVLSELVSRRALDRVIDVSTRVDLLAFESPEFYDRLQRARMQGQFRSLQTVNGLLGIAGASVAGISLLGALATLQPLLLPFVLVAYIPLWAVTSRNTRDLYHFMHGMTPNDRQRNYLQNVLMDRHPAKEVRAFQLAPFLRRRYDRLYDERIVELRALARRRTGRALLGAFGSSALTAAAVGVLAWLFVSDRMSLAATGAAVFGLYQLSSRLRAIHMSASSLYEATLFIRDYASFLTLQPRVQSEGLPAGRLRRLSVDGVTFAYPEAPIVLHDVSLEIAEGEIVALVGENGSGKTTLAKLVAGLYRPELGVIRWNGHDIAELHPEDLRREIAVIFQDFEKYRLPARENIGVGRHERIEEEAAILEAARRADADDFVSALPDGYETMLGREFSGGYDLSVGQWQKLALARAFFRDASLVVLDEPTAALDPRAESRLFESMRELLEGRSALLISHRFSSVRSADRIYVLRDGTVVEHGTHGELLDEDGLYAELFRLQAAAYLSEGAELR